MPDEEFKVEVELGNDEHHLSFWERLRSLDVDDEARKRLGGRVTVTRDGNWIQLYTHTLDDAQEAERTVRELVAGDHLDAEFTVSRWDAGKQEWVDPTDGAGVTDDAKETPAPDPSYVILEAYKPEFLRDLGL
jgi:VCBS repeat-containing protein